MIISHTISIAAQKPDVFSLYEDVASWTKWDPELTSATLDGGLVPNATGTLKPLKGPAAKIKVVDLVPGEAFTVESRLPLCTMHFGHELKSIRAGTNVTHWVRFTGPLAFVFRVLIGRGLDAGLPKTLAGLKAAAEDMRKPQLR